MTTDDELMSAYVAGAPRRSRRCIGGTSSCVRVLRAGVRRPRDRRGSRPATFFHLHRARESYRPGLPVGGWIFRIAYNLYRDELRRRGRYPTDSHRSDVRSDGGDGRDEAVWNQRAAQIRVASDATPEGQPAFGLALLARVYARVPAVHHVQHLGPEVRRRRVRWRARDLPAVPGDCGTCAACGEFVCDTGESMSTCPGDCP